MGEGDAGDSPSNPSDRADVSNVLLPPKKRRRFTAELAALPSRPESSEVGGAQPSGASASTSAPLDVKMDVRNPTQTEPVGSQHAVEHLISIRSVHTSEGKRAPGLFAWPSLLPKTQHCT
jgi:hypothetical protein